MREGWLQFDSQEGEAGVTGKECKPAGGTSERLTIAATSLKQRGQEWKGSEEDSSLLSSTRTKRTVRRHSPKCWFSQGGAADCMHFSLQGGLHAGGNE